MRIHLRAGEKFYVNGAVIQVDRKVTVSFLNDVTFLLENHVLQPEEAATPLKQLYFIVQTALIDPAHSDESKRLFGKLCATLIETASDPELKNGLEMAYEQFSKGRTFDVLKSIRALFPLEDQLIVAPETTSEKYNELNTEVS